MHFPSSTQRGPRAQLSVLYEVESELLKSFLIKTKKVIDALNCFSTLADFLFERSEVL
jgi:hypothetical protein